MDTKWLNHPTLQKLFPWMIPAFLIIIWQILAQVGYISTRVLPAPTDVLSAGIDSFNSGALLRNISVSAWRAAQGFLVGGSIGFGLGLINGISPISEKLLDSSIQMVRNIPHLALIPLVILWFGIGEEGKLFLVAFGVFFPIYINTFHGIRTVDGHLLEMGRTYGLRTHQLFWQIILPGAMPNILVGVRYALGFMWLTLIVAETIAADTGIGFMAMDAREFMRTDIVVLSILLYALLGKLADIVVRALEHSLLSWHPNYR